MLDLDWGQILDHASHLAVAYVLALPSALDREAASRSAGLRTYPLVAIGACAFLLVGESFLVDPTANARLMQGLIGGLGFLGGGAILKSQGNVIGMATAASIWNTGAVGMAVAYNRYEIAIVLAVLNFATLRLGRKFKKDLDLAGDGEADDGPRRDA
ncbi:MAG: MgtC/SapB family protein [Akkermansiaceae bacterium]|nr:MgtC/SapB family protein [Akkermansiaceae bacterium]NNM30367.1 MgtC/SapB family protein [Akkermansiaceae bacterium]